MATLLKNCRIYDGTGSDAVNGSVLFEGDRIIEVGDVVARGDSIGFVGRYGTGPHLNISATKDGASIDPATIIKP